MWNGRWSKELSLLYDLYIDMFGVEPDCDTDMDFDKISYNEWCMMIKRHLASRKRLQ